MTLSYYFTRGVWLIALVLGLAHPAFAQLTLDAFSPIDGATDVNTTATVAFTFSAALDTETLFEGDLFPFDDFFLNLEIDPDPGVPLDVRVGDDGQTVAIDFQLEEDTKYQVILEGAFSTTGAGLDRPHEFTFTTGDALPRGTVSGTITFDGGDPTGTVVAIFRSESGNPSFEDDTEAAAVVTDVSGNYTADFVSAGDYVVAAFKDLNGDGVADDPLEDALRAYDGDGDSVVDVLTVGDGETIDDIDLSIQVLDRSTARGPFPFALTLARLAAPDAHLSLVLAEVTPEGTSPTWAYGFYSPATQDTLGLFAIGDQFAFEPGVLEDDDAAEGDTLDPIFDLTTPLPEDWIDSDVAVDSAEARGGADFRAANPDAQITTFLANLPEELCVLLGTFGRTGLILPEDRSPGALSTKIAQLARKTAATVAARA
ncbi:MAG: Ig-like domain-containing protein, partial [Rhodothermales bacterium]